MARTKKRLKEPIILEKAAILFANKGYTDTCMREIAQAAGLEKGSLYHYFSSKEEILHRIMRGPSVEGIGTLQKIVEMRLSPLDKLKEAVHNHVQVFDDKFPLAFVSLHENWWSHDKEIRDEVMSLQKQYEQLFTGIIEEGMKAGQFRRDLNPRLTCYGILGMFNWMYKWYKKGGFLSGSYIADYYFALISPGLLAKTDAVGKRGHASRRKSGDTSK